MKYATFEGDPCIYTDAKAWVLFNPPDGWREVPLAEVLMTAEPLPKEEFERRFPDLPALPG